MGQNSSKEEWAEYSSREFFGRQVELYRWRADQLVNTHICRVSFQPQASLKDRERLKTFLQADQIPLSQLMAMTNVTREGEQLMSFQQYLCTLADLVERLSLQQVLYVLQAMFSGYQVILRKIGRCRADLISCFVTNEGEVRVWLGADYRSNQLQEDGEGRSSIISSEMTLIRRILDLGEQLASNHTEFLHFTRQFRSCMERDILQNWNFANARKLVNSYLYTYRINLPPNIKQTAMKAIKCTPTHSQMASVYDNHTHSYPSPTQSFITDPKNELQSTVSGFLRQTNYQSRKQNQRPLSHSDYSNSKKSQSIVENSLKSHSKKFSSTDLKHQGERGKAFESPKMSRSQLLPHKSKEDLRQHGKEGMQYSSMQGQRMRRQRQFAKVGERDQTKLYNFSTSVGFSPDTNSLIQGEDSNCHDYSNPSALKQNQQAKQKKKLEKKVATISKYISYYQQQSQASKQSDIIEEPILNTKSNIVHYTPQSPPVFEQRQIHPPPSPSPAVNYNIKNKGDIKMVHKLSYELKNIHAARQVEKGRTEFNRSHGNSQHSNTSSQDNTIPRMCLTVKTLNKLLENNQVSLHQSNGSFMSMEQSQSEYSGALCKMGRSVNILNAPSGKEFNLQKSNPSNAMNRSINC